MDTKLLAQYRALQDQFAILETEREILRAEIVEMLEKEGLQKLKSDYGTFTRASRVLWTYSLAIKKLEDKVKIAKFKEQKQGKASSVENYYLVYSNKKDE